MLKRDGDLPVYSIVSAVGFLGGGGCWFFPTFVPESKTIKISKSILEGGGGYGGFSNFCSRVQNCQNLKSSIFSRGGVWVVVVVGETASESLG